MNKKFTVKVAKNAATPSSVRYDNDLSDKSKLMYPEIAGLSYKKGYCHAGNLYFSELLNCSERTVQRCIEQLIDQKHIVRHLIYFPGTKKVKQRRLILTDKIFAESQNIILVDSPYLDDQEPFEDTPQIESEYTPENEPEINGDKNDTTEINGDKNDTTNGDKNVGGVVTKMSCIPITSIPITSIPFTEKEKRFKKEKTDQPEIEKQKRDALKKSVGVAQFKMIEKYDLQKIPLKSRKSFVEFLSYRREIKKPYKSKSAMTKIVNQFVTQPPDVMIKTVEFTIENQYQGLFVDRVLKNIAIEKKRQNRNNGSSEPVTDEIKSEFNGVGDQIKKQIEKKKERVMYNGELDDIDVDKFFNDSKNKITPAFVEHPLERRKRLERENQEQHQIRS